jgi:uncharacterized protein YjbJ (UPF0337 family)
MEYAMDVNRIEGAVKEGAGKVQDLVGDLTGDAGLKAEGRLNQAAGAAQGAYGRARESVDSLLDDLVGYTKAQPLIALAGALAAGLVAGLLIWGGRSVSRR